MPIKIIINANINVQLANSDEVAVINHKLDQIIANEEKIMSDLTAEFGALTTAFESLSTEIDKEFQQLAEAVAAGNADRATVEDARARVSALTSSITEKVAVLASDNPPEQ